MRRASVATLSLLSLLACNDDPFEDLVLGTGVVVEGVLRVEPVWDSESGELESCALSAGESTLSGTIILDTLAWTELDLPFLARNGGSERAQGTRYFDLSITPSGVARVYWSCDRTFRPALPSSVLDGGVGDGPYFDADAGLLPPEDSGTVLAIDAGPASPLPPDPEDPYAPLELVLHRRDRERSFCRTLPPSFGWGPWETEASTPAVGDRVFGGQTGRLLVRVVPAALGEDIDFELQLGALAVECCEQSNVPSCAGPLVGAACDRLRGELMEPDDELIRELARRPSTLWMRAYLQFEFHDPYGGPIYPVYPLRIGFCRGCGGQTPRSVGPKVDATLECFARRMWESPGVSGP